MFNQALADKIVEYLNVAFPDKIQFDDLRAALTDFSPLSEDEWLKSLDALNQDGRIEFKGIRTGIDHTLHMVANIVITNAERSRLATPRGAGPTVSSALSGPRPTSHSDLAVFISHSSKDAGLGGWPTFDFLLLVLSRLRLPHLPRFSEGGYHRPRLLVDSTRTPLGACVKLRSLQPNL
jgi:hypothetical protein